LWREHLGNPPVFPKSFNKERDHAMTTIAEKEVGDLPDLTIGLFLGVPLVRRNGVTTELLPPASLPCDRLGEGDQLDFRSTLFSVHYANIHS
jgi:hypothetical protein